MHREHLNVVVRFTIHFATINTYLTRILKDKEPEFTIHFATINTPLFL